MAIDVAIPPTAHDILQGAAEISRTGQAISLNSAQHLPNRGADSDRYRLRGGPPFVAGINWLVQQLSAGAVAAAGNKVERLRPICCKTRRSVELPQQELERLCTLQKSGRRLEVCDRPWEAMRRGRGAPVLEAARSPWTSTLDLGEAGRPIIGTCPRLADASTGALPELQAEVRLGDTAGRIHLCRAAQRPQFRRHTC